MKLLITFEAHESVPPAIYAQLRKALGHIVEQYGLGVHIDEDRSAELEAYQRYWQWQRQLLDGDWPAVPADAEVK